MIISLTSFPNILDTSRNDVLSHWDLVGPNTKVSSG